MQEAVEQTHAKRYMSYRDAEHYSGLSRWTLFRACERGELHKITVGTTVRFDREDLDQFMQSRKS